MTASQTTAFRASILDFVPDLSSVEDIGNSYRYIEDGLLVIQNGKVQTIGDTSALLKNIPDQTVIIDYRGKLILPGFIDIHLHYPQMEMMAAYGEELMEWLEKYTYPVERKYADKDYARSIARIFLKELLRHGTTSAMVFGTVHRSSIEALFEEADALNMQLIAGKVMMDRNAPDYLLDTPKSGYQDSKALIEKWHQKGRLLYALTPRFAPTSSNRQLDVIKQLLNEYPSVYVQTHLSENRQEIQRVLSLFPNCKHYLDVYAKFGLLTNRAVFAHGIHLSQEEFKQLGKTGASIAFCPASNLFLGSGLFKYHETVRNGIKVGMGSDIGGGTSLCMFKILADAYKISRLLGQRFSALNGFFLATLGGAQSLAIADRVGNFAEGKDADFVVADLEPTPFFEFRMSRAADLIEKLFILMMLGDDRNIYATYIMGKKAYDREEIDLDSSHLYLKQTRN